MERSEAQTRRIRRSVKNGAVLLAVGIAYYIFVRATGCRIPCLLTLFTKNLCPGCGITRMFLALADLDFQRAFRCNALVLCALPFILAFGTRYWLRYLKTGSTQMDALEKVLVIIAAVLTLLFWILRNIEAFSFLAPV